MHKDTTPIVENQMEKRIEKSMDTVVVWSNIGVQISSDFTHLQHRDFHAPSHARAS